jgi:hypothetical protein
MLLSLAEGYYLASQKPNTRVSRMGRIIRYEFLSISSFQSCLRIMPEKMVGTMWLRVAANFTSVLIAAEHFTMGSAAEMPVRDRSSGDRST